MSVAFDTDGRHGRYTDTDEKQYTYAITGNGVLQILALEIEESTQRIAAEVSPAYWRSVVGDRFVGDTAGIPGSKPPMSAGQAHLEFMKNEVAKHQPGM
ncbi:hypothetical protein SPF06_02465 [Sinomonas sp. JGH33]|uniref:Uncharacterized protein n=1 Tax=Sinomonas terricola TaxID=3110330 RepID=A0ABU5T345_9MICC|nr:hypothetical protein [Sinomonas sp. JGH33]MEA5453576.1 hypothetical protein [Sinomonas sp. JGH33]